MQKRSLIVKLAFEIFEMSSKANFTHFGPFEVVVHNTPDDCWVSLLGKVLNITPLIKKYENDQCIKPLLAMAGKDISHWFDEKTGDIMHYIHPETGIRVPYCPHGRLPDVQVYVPSSEWRPLDHVPWWQDGQYQIGWLSKNVRPLRILNMLTFKQVQINVCCEDTFHRIKERYRPYCKNVGQYSWRYNDKNIDMNFTMDENGIVDERECFIFLDLPQNYYVPCVFLYFNSNITDDMESSSD